MIPAQSLGRAACSCRNGDSMMLRACLQCIAHKYFEKGARHGKTCAHHINGFSHTCRTWIAQRPWKHRQCTSFQTADALRAARMYPQLTEHRKISWHIPGSNERGSSDVNPKLCKIQQKLVFVCGKSMPEKNLGKGSGRTPSLLLAQKKTLWNDYNPVP